MAIDNWTFFLADSRIKTVTMDHAKLARMQASVRIGM